MIFIIAVFLIISLIICIFLAPILTLVAFQKCVILKMPKGVTSTLSIDILIVSFCEVLEALGWQSVNVFSKARVDSRDMITCLALALGDAAS